MAMMNYTPIRLPPTADPILRNELLKVDRFLRQLTPFAARTPSYPQGTNASFVDLSLFLYLPGRSPYQRAEGTVVFSAKTQSEAAVLDDSVFKGLTILGTSNTNPQKTHTVYFQPDAVAGINIIRKWIFPSLTGSATDTFTFATESGTQTLTNKTITTSNIYVGTAAARNIFTNSNNTNQQFFISPNTNFPTTAVQTPQIRLPALDVQIPVNDRHTIMMMHTASNTPFTSGSIAHGNYNGSEMEMLPAGSNGGLLQYNVGETVAGVTWTTGTFVITGTFDLTKTRVGMRVTGSSSSSIYVDTDTRITIATATTLTVDTALVGNSVGTTIIIFGPIWTTSLALASMEHSNTTDRTTFALTTVTNATTLLTSAALFANVQVGHMIFGAGIPAGTTVSVVTDASNLTMSAAATDSTSASRTFASDDHAQYLTLYGRSANGQHIGTSPQPGGTKNPDDVSMSGRLNIGTSVFVADTSLQVSKTVTAAPTTLNFARVTPTFSPTGAVNTEYRAFLAQILGGGTISSGSPIFIGGKFIVTPTGSSAFTIGRLTGLDMQASILGTQSSVAIMYGINGSVNGNANYPGTAVYDITSQMTAINMTINPNKSSAVAVYGINFQVDAATPTGGVVDVMRGINLETLFNTGTFTGFTLAGTVTLGSNTITAITPTNVTVGMLAVGSGGSSFPTGTYVTVVAATTVTVSANATAGGANVTFNGAITNYSGIYMSSDRPGNCLTVRVLDLQSDDESQHFGRFYFRPPTPAAYPAPTAWIHVGAGAAAVSSAPLKFTSGTSLTAAEAGAVEFTTDDLFFTITTGPARKRLLMADPTGGLTSGRVPFATTNGRLTDDADMTFATDTLTVTKIAATTFTGDPTLADAVNIPVGTGTGTKIATATTQKIGFWNTAPIVQPTTAGAAATFVTNTSLIANDTATFDGYTLGQVVKALRNAGLLA